MSDVKATTPFAKFLGLSLRRNGAKAAGGRRKGRTTTRSPIPTPTTRTKTNARTPALSARTTRTTSQAAKGGALRNRTTTRRTIRTMSTPRTKTMKQELRMMATMTRIRRHARPQRLSELAPAKSSRMASIRAASRQLLSLRSPLACRLLPPYVCWINKLRQICGQRVAPMGYMAA